MPAMPAESMRPRSVFAELGVKPVINCCGIYTDLGGSVLSPSVWAAATELNNWYVRMTDLLDATGELIANIAGAEAARVTPGASAAIALAVAATMTGEQGEHWEQLPSTRGLKNEVLISTAHLRNYKYAVCARMPGAQLVAAGPTDRFDARALLAAVKSSTACIFVPAHLLDGFSGVEQLSALTKAAEACGVPVVVDAAYMSYPVELLPQYARCGAALTCFSAKYFFGPNSGGFVAGRRDLIRAVQGLDFTRFESGKYRSFGRAFKMSRYDIATTALALRDWVTLDHEQRWAGYAAKVAVLMQALSGVPGVRAEPLLFTMSEELVRTDKVNCVLLSFAPGAGRSAQSLAVTLESQSPIIAAIVEKDHLIVAVDTLLDGQETVVAQRLRSALS